MAMNLRLSPETATALQAEAERTGRSQQEFMSVYVGPLETEATVIQLRLVIGTDEALTAARPLPGVATTPARPAPRP